MTVLLPTGRLAVLVAVCAAIWWEPAPNTLRATVLVGVQWGLLLALVLGFLLIKRQL